MRTRFSRAVPTLLAASLLALPVAAAPQEPMPDPEKGTRAGSPLDDLPPHIRLVSPTGMRPDWSPDGEQLVYLDAPLGRLHIVDVASGESRALPDPANGFGVLRAHFLSNRDLLLCAPARAVAPSSSGAGRFEGVLFVLRAPYDAAPQPLGAPCFEGVAVSRTSLRIAWNRADVRFDSAPANPDFVGEIWTGEIAYDDDGRAYLHRVAKAFDRKRLPFGAVPEVQAFRGEGDRELVFSAYGLGRVQIFAVDTRTDELRALTEGRLYEEAEGLSPDGAWILVERNIESAGEPGALDIWRLGLAGDAAGTWERMTNFNRYRGEEHPFYASNPVVSPDGRRFAFQLAIDGPTEGEGRAILIYELSERAGTSAP